MKHIISAVEKNVGKPIKFAGDCMGEEAKKMAADLKPGEIMLLEQLTVHTLLPH